MTMTIKKVISFLLVLSLLFGIGGCAMKEKTPDLSLLNEGLIVADNPEVDSRPDARERGFFGPEEGVFNQHHLELLAYYRKAFEHYMLVTLRLDLIDQKIEASGLGFLPTYDLFLSRYEKETMLGLKHLYLMSDLHIERLSNSDLALLEELYAQSGSTVTQEALDLVERTYPELIKIHQVGGAPAEGDSYVSLIPATPGVHTDTLMIAFTNSPQYDNDGMYVPGDKYLKREEYLLAYLPKLQKELSAKIPVPVTLYLVDSSAPIYMFDDRGTWQGMNLIAPRS